MGKIPGDFVPLDVRYRRDRAIRSAGIAAELLYVRSLAHARGNDTGGIIEDYDLPDLTAGMADSKAPVAALVRVGLWVALSPTAWLIRSFEKWNPINDRSADGRLGNHNRWHVGRGLIAPDCEYCTPPTSPPDIAPESPPISEGESQTRLEETREEEKRGAISASPLPEPKSKRGKRLPEGWAPSETVRQAMLEELPSVDFAAEHRKFADHWRAQPGRQGVKSDWDAVWRNWMRRAGEFAPRHLRAVSGESPEWKVIDGPPAHLINPDRGLFDL